MATGTCCKTQGAQHYGLWWPRGAGGREGGPRGTGCMCTHTWFTSLYSTDQHNIAKQLYSKNVKQWNKICYLYNKIMRPCLWKCFITLQSFITERCSPRDRSYITTVQFSLPQQSKDWSTVRTPFTDGISEGPHGEGSLSTLVDQPHKQCAVVPPSMNPFPSRLVICFRLPHLSFTKWHLETLHALMSLKLSCLPA